MRGWAEEDRANVTRSRILIAALLGSLLTSIILSVLIGIGDAESVDQYASVASVGLSVLGLAAALMSFVASRRETRVLTPRMRRLAVAIVFLITVGAVGFVVKEGIAQLGSLSDLLLLGAGSGVFAFAAVEFIKRQSPLRTEFQQRAVLRFFGTDLAAIVPQLVVRGLIQGNEGQPARREVTDNLLRSLWPGTYSGTVQQLTAQLALTLRGLLALASAAEIPDSLRGTIWRLVLGEESTRILSGLAVAPRTGIPDAASELLEQRLDTFQISTQNRWRYLLRVWAAAIAGLTAGMSAWAMGTAAAGITVAVTLGIVVGGPAAWLARDLVRVVEHKARFG